MTSHIRVLSSHIQFHPGPLGFFGAKGPAKQALGTFLLWCERSRQRRHLAQLTARELTDVGISRAAAIKEAAKPFWQA